MSKSRSRDACERLFRDAVVVGSAAEFVAAPRDLKTISFIDGTTLASLDNHAMAHAQPAERRKLLMAVSTGPVIAVCGEPLATAIGWLQPRPWLSHVIDAGMLQGKRAAARVAELTTLGGSRYLLDWLKPEVGRRVRITHASGRSKRLERMSEFLRSQRVGARAVTALVDATNELLANAFYKAPVAAGVEPKRLVPSRDVALPEDFACDIAYGCRDDLAIVRVRDPFGALSRDRLVDVLARRAREPAPADAASGERGLWRVFSAASIVAVSVNTNRHTQVLVAIPRDGAGPHSYAFHFVFKDGEKRGFWRLLDEDTGSQELNTSVTLSLVE